MLNPNNCYVSEGIINFSAAEDEYYRIATGNCLAMDQNSQEEQISPARYRLTYPMYHDITRTLADARSCVKEKKSG